MTYKLILWCFVLLPLVGALHPESRLRCQKVTSGMARRNSSNFGFRNGAARQAKDRACHIFPSAKAHNLTDTALQPFADDILANGLNIVLTAIDQGEEKLVTDGKFGARWQFCNLCGGVPRAGQWTRLSLSTLCPATRPCWER